MRNQQDQQPTGDTEMEKVAAIIKHFKLDELKNNLAANALASVK